MLSQTQYGRARLFLGGLLYLLTYANASLGDDGLMSTASLVERDYHEPSDVEIETYRGFLRDLDRFQSSHRRLAYRCTASMGMGATYINAAPERFVSIRAIDRKLDAIRCTVRRTVTKEDDPKLQSIQLDWGGYAESGTSNVDMFPDFHDRLQIGDRIYFSPKKSISVDQDRKHHPQGYRDDREFDPITLSFLTVPSFFHGNLSRMRISELFPIATIKTPEVSFVADSFVTRAQVMSQFGPTPSVVFTEFDNGLPVRFEFWDILKRGNELKARTETTWKELNGVHLPIRIEASEVNPHVTRRFVADLEWRFDDDVPDRFFELDDLDPRGTPGW